MAVYEWTRELPLDGEDNPVARRSHASIACGNRMLVFGGFISTDAVLNDLSGVERCSPHAGTARTQQSPQFRFFGRIEAIATEHPPDVVVVGAIIWFVQWPSWSKVAASLCHHGSLWLVLRAT